MIRLKGNKMGIIEKFKKVSERLVKHNLGQKGLINYKYIRSYNDIDGWHSYFTIKFKEYEVNVLEDTVSIKYPIYTFETESFDMHKWLDELLELTEELEGGE